ncbi:MAG: class I SAM-dependent methyltransferase [Candidatus Limivivens sp.]|nr:class I SAM-dependent methyltransferase [Candidatus Limivivens sp.]
MNKLDYCQLWTDMMQTGSGNRNQYENPETARSYDNSIGIWKDGRLRAAAFPFSGSDTVLDIGSGPGILAVPLAHKVKEVTAVEPSEAMRELLKKHCEEEKIQNVYMIGTSWEQVDYASLPGYDYVIASYSLNMPDIRKALLAMNQVARKRVYLYWFCGTTTWNQLQMDLYPQIHGCGLEPSPRSDLLYGALCQLGISADVKHLEGTSFSYRFPDLKAALMNIRQRVGVSSDQYDDLLTEYILTHYKREGSSWIFYDRTNYVEISWKPKKTAGGEHEA